MKVIDQINESGFFAQSAYSADTATNDSLGRNISETYQTTAGMTAYQPSGEYITGQYLTADALDNVSGTWNTVTNKLDSTAFSTVSGDFVTGTATGTAFMQNGTAQAAFTGITGVASMPIIATTLQAAAVQGIGGAKFFYGPSAKPFSTGTGGIYSPLQYATGACLAMSAGTNGQNNRAYYKANEWYVSDSGQRNGAVRAEVHNTRGTHISGALPNNDGFDLLTSGLKFFSGSTTSVVDPASIGQWNSVYNTVDQNSANWGDMHESSFSYGSDNKITAYNGSAFNVDQVITSTGGNANYVNQLNNKGISATVAYKAHLDEGNHSISALYDTVSTNSASWQTVNTSAGIIGNGTTESPLMTDETVLYSGTRNVSGVLNDSPFNYDRIRIYLDLGHQGENPARSDQAFEFPMRGTTADNRVNMFYAKGYNNAWFSVMQVALTPTYFSAVRCKSINMGPFNTTTTTFTANLNSDEDMKAIVQIVGINKINNG